MCKNILLIVLSILIIFIIIMIPGCAVDNNITDAEKTNDVSKDTGIDAETEYKYEFPNVNYGGAEFYVLNPDSKVWAAFSDIVIDEANGEILNDTVYNRNLQIEELFNIKLKQDAVYPGNTLTKARKQIQTGEDVYDAMFLGYNWEGAIGTIMLDGGFYNLAEITEFHFDQPWWNQNIVNQLKIGSSDSLYFALNDIDVVNMQNASLMYFNENMMQDLGLEPPYSLVKNGKWTLDEYAKYLKAAANLNGDENWKWNKNGNSIYGHVSYHYGVTAVLFGSDITIIDSDNNNLPYLAIENEHFYSAVQKISNILSVPGQFIYQDTDTPGSNRFIIFMTGRSLFIDSTLTAPTELREMDEPFGILPMPKYDELQENYLTLIHSLSTFTTIPITNPDPQGAAAVLDAMAYLSYKEVRPVYFDIALPYKHLRTEESIDMIKILMDTRIIHVGYVYDWTSSFLNNDMRKLIREKNPNIASAIEKNKNTINDSIQKTIDFFNK